MKIYCCWEHNGDDTLLYSTDFPGAFTRGASKAEAVAKMPREIISFARWQDFDIDDIGNVEIIQRKASALDIRDADSDVIFDTEKDALTTREYERLKALVLRSAMDFQTLYDAIPDKDIAYAAPRKTFYGDVPRTARAMYEHTKNVNNYYFGEIGVAADNEGNIFECRQKGFESLERADENFLLNSIKEGSYSEMWSLRKMMRRFIWHDRIHAKAMWRMATKFFESIPNVFSFDE